jgi:hypothetical protein
MGRIIEKYIMENKIHVWNHQPVKISHVFTYPNVSHVPFTLESRYDVAQSVAYAGPAF